MEQKINYNFCTLFDSNYLTRGVLMYESLQKTGILFHLYIFCFDEASYNILQQLKLKDTTLITIQEFEDDDLKRIKSTRTIGEYCWTCTSSIILYIFEKFNLSICTYLDADLYFFKSPECILQEAYNNSVLITPHWFSDEYKDLEEYGLYNVQFLMFKNDDAGIKILKKWRQECIEWCYSRLEDGKFGDQKYLDKWKSYSDKVIEIKHRGGGIAPWNILQYKIDNEGLLKYNGLKYWMVFYHFHDFKFCTKEGYVKISKSRYNLPKECISIIYLPYIYKLLDICLRVEKINDKINVYGFKFDYENNNKYNQIFNEYKHLILNAFKDKCYKKILSSIFNFRCILNLFETRYDRIKNVYKYN